MMGVLFGLDLDYYDKFKFFLNVKESIKVSLENLKATHSRHANKNILQANLCYNFLYMILKFLCLFF